MMRNRKPNRLKYHNYSENGVYFITICAKNKRKVFGEVVGGGALDAPFVKLSSVGEIAERHIRSTEKIHGVVLKNFVIMPNHIHLLVSVECADCRVGTSRAPSPTNDVIPRLVAVLKRLVNIDAGMNVFQRSYHDHIVRNEKDYLRIWEYIDNNPTKWNLDCFYM